MTHSQGKHTIRRLLDLRGREVDRLSADMAARRSVRERYRNNLRRLEHLCQTLGPSASLPPALSLNCAEYKQAVLELAHVHRDDLALHEADMAVAQTALTTAYQKHQALGSVVARRQACEQRERTSREQKRQDEIAAQVWLRGRS